MPIQAPIAPSAAPATPDRKDRATFSNRVDAGLAYVATAVTESKSLADCAYTNAQESVTQANAAAAQATAATAQANTAAASAAAAVATANAAAFVGATAYAQNANAISQINFKTYRRKTAGQNATDPANDPTNWVDLIGAPSAMVWLATIAPSGGVNVDFLNVFTADYDEYEIVISGVTPSTTDALYARLAVAGAVISTSVYNDGGTNVYNYILASANVSADFGGCSAIMRISNATSTTTFKPVTVAGSSQSGATSYASLSSSLRNFITTASALSGIRFFWSSGATFKNVGSIKIYGIKK